MKPTPDIKNQLSSSIYTTICWALLNEPNCENTWARAKAAVDYEIARYSNYVVSCETVIDGTFYDDIVAQQCSSYEEYVLKCHIANIEPCAESEFEVRHAVKNDNDVYFKVEILWDGDSKPEIICGSLM